MAVNILVVEDEPLGRALICEVLRREGYEVSEAGDGAEALELLRGQRYDLVISDFIMPRLDGLKLLAQLHSIYPTMPVILISAYMSADSGQKIMQEMAEFIPKPFELETLRSTVQRLLLPVLSIWLDYGWFSCLACPS
jgi:CheY-like chemotaxis protein